MEAHLEELLEEDEGLHYQHQRRPIFRKDRHLSSALVTSEIEYMLLHKENPREVKREHRELLAHVESTRAQILHSKDFFSWAMVEWKNFSYNKESLTGLTSALRVAQEALRISTLNYTGMERLISISPNQELTILYNIKVNFDRVISEITYSHDFHQSYMLGQYKGDTYGTLHLLWKDDGICWLITHSHFVGLRDIYGSWFSTILYSMTNENKYPGFNLYEEVSRTLEAGKQLVSRFKQDAYSFLKVWPFLVIASILRDTEGKKEFSNQLIKDLTRYENTKIFRLATRKIATDIQAQLHLELTGLWKCFGHPDILMTESVNSWISKGTVMKPIDQEIPKLLAAAFRLEFSRQFYKDKKIWPRLYIGPTTPAKIKTSYINNTWGETPSNQWCPEDFFDTRFEKNLDFDYHIELSDLLSDKSIIPSLTQWIHEYDKQAHRTMYGFFPRGPSATSKSVIVHYLTQDSISVKEVLDIISKGDIPSEWRVMVAVPKEKEFKGTNARFYGKMTFEMRLFQTITEKNIAEGVFPYIKHQSMTMNEEQLLRTIQRMTTPSSLIIGDAYVFIVLDFSSWCTNFRYEFVFLFFTELDSLW
ncbi:hypothetical protein PUN28_016888 [Cardiocondyla obscurior]|uniref:RdRp catalytic domain-containing protein n=1 Tax=Cardiocondyla obscurior TaxID=286306 RepID=A0AAW2ESY8_9HYME